MLYAVKDTTLEAMGDAVRRYTLGEPEEFRKTVQLRFNDGQYPIEYYQTFYNNISPATKVVIHNITGINGENYSSDSLGTVGIIRGTYYTSWPSLNDVDVVIPKDTTFPFEMDAITKYTEFSLYYDAVEGNEKLIVDVEYIPLDDNKEEFKYTPTEMVEEVNNILDDYANEAIVPEDKLIIQGGCRYLFYDGNWDWFIQRYKDKITTNDITNVSYMFGYSLLEEIPFDINLRWYENTNMEYMFSYASKLTELPKIPKAKPMGLRDIFSGCKKIEHIPQDYCDGWDFSYLTSQTNAYSGSQQDIFYGCNALRSYPNSILSKGNPVAAYSNSIYYGTFNSCYALDEIVDLPFPHYNAEWTSNSFQASFSNCLRLKRLTFALQEDGTPYVVKWKSQTIDLTQNVGYGTYNTTYDYIPTTKRVTDDATYQALKDDADWYTTNADYSRYNHDSAVETINSLPDASAYLATKGGTNTIKFRSGGVGRYTDGGAINTLTEEEIAVAVAKGWTVTLV